MSSVVVSCVGTSVAVVVSEWYEVEDAEVVAKNKSVVSAVVAVVELN